MNKPIIVISSHVARGSVGNRAAVFALEVLGHPVWAVPTIILPFHPGHGIATRIIPPADQFDGLLNDLLNSRWITEIGAVLTGYLANADQVKAVAKFITAIKQRSPEVIHACDPVMGDRPKDGNGRLYIANETASAIKEHLVPVADILTPNRFELSWLTGKTIDTPQQAVDATAEFKEKKILVTSMPGYMRGNIGNLLVEGETSIFAEHKELANPPNG
ncbi:MAG: pyridoxal kinase, partial [Salaquimonas sp.]